MQFSCQFFLDTTNDKRHLPAHLKRVPEPRGRRRLSPADARQAKDSPVVSRGGIGRETLRSKMSETDISIEVADHPDPI